mgnify:CR=1 FL=1|jgi:hypothetical protein|tara:strand:+ start:385 stop:645 length:261 start_codon:yes stop_codon:yes gene_type:complete
MGAWEDGFAAGWRAAHNPTAAFDMGPAANEAFEEEQARRSRKRKGKKNPALSRAMKKAYKKAHLKNGKFRKGWNRSKMLKYAHKIK